MDAATFRRIGHQLVDWIAAYRERIAELPVRSPCAPGAIRAQFAASPPQQPPGLDGIVAALDAQVLPGITHWNHPSFFAYFPSNASYASVLADLVTAGLGAQGMSWETSPAATELEEVVMDWLRQLLGLPAGFEGVIHDTASTATLCALACARERTLGFAPGGLQERSAPLVVYASDQAHSSVEKAARLAGFGKRNLRLVASDEHHALRADALSAAIADDRAQGRVPCAIVATSGTTATTAFDPLADCAALAQEHGLWLHVDAAMAGCAMLLPECRALFAGIEHADSLVLNPHKWLGTGFDLSAYFVRDAQHLIRVMGTNPSYLRTARDAEVKNLRDWGIPLGRRFRALKLWFLLLDRGVDGLQQHLRRGIALAQRFAAAVDRAPDWQRLAAVPLQTVCLRHRPAGLDEAALARHNLAIAQHINDSGRAYLTPTVVKGTQLLRVSIGAERTTEREVDDLWTALQAAARR